MALIDRDGVYTDSKHLCSRGQNPDDVSHHARTVLTGWLPRSHFWSGDRHPTNGSLPLSAIGPSIDKHLSIEPPKKWDKKVNKVKYEQE